MEKRGGKFVCGAARGAADVFMLKMVDKPIKTVHATIDLRTRHRINPRPRPMKVDDGLEDIRWIRGLWGERFPATSYVLVPHQKIGLFFAIGEGSRMNVVCFLHASGQMSLYRTPG